MRKTVKQTRVLRKRERHAGGKKSYFFHKIFRATNHKTMHYADINKIQPQLRIFEYYIANIPTF